MDDLPDPSEWARHRFGAAWWAVATGLATAGRAAHERALDAQHGSQLTTNEPYGATFWLALPEEVARALSPVAGVTPIRVQRARYPLLVIADSLLFAVRVAQTPSGSGHLAMRPSSLRSEIMSIRDYPGQPTQDPFDFGPAFERPDDPARIRATLEGIERTILVAYEADPRAGLLRVHIGEATLDDADGRITWLHYEQLPLTTLLGLEHLAVLPDTEDTEFDAAPLPTLVLRLRDLPARAVGDCD